MEEIQSEEDDDEDEQEEENPESVTREERQEHSFRAGLSNEDKLKRSAANAIKKKRIVSTKEWIAARKVVTAELGQMRKLINKDTHNVRGLWDLQIIMFALWKTAKEEVDDMRGKFVG
jgi:hypothetical protein